MLSHDLPAGLGDGQHNIYKHASRKDTSNQLRFPLLDWLQQELDDLQWSFGCEVVEKQDPRSYTDDEGQLHTGGRQFQYTIFKRLAEACYDVEKKVRRIAYLMACWVSCDHADSQPHHDDVPSSGV